MLSEIPSAAKVHECSTWKRLAAKWKYFISKLKIFKRSLSESSKAFFSFSGFRKPLDTISNFYEMCAKCSV